MSVQTALGFIARVREDDELRGAIAALGHEATGEQLAAIAAGAGFSIDEAELREAHALDWQLRWMRLAAAPDA